VDHSTIENHWTDLNVNAGGNLAKSATHDQPSAIVTLQKDGASGLTEIVEGGKMEEESLF